MRLNSAGTGMNETGQSPLISNEAAWATPAERCISSKDRRLRHLPNLATIAFHLPHEPSVLTSEAHQLRFTFTDIAVVRQLSTVLDSYSTASEVECKRQSQHAPLPAITFKELL